MPEIPAGMQKLMSTFGLSPEVLKGMLEGPLKAFAAKVDELQATMNRVEANQRSIMAEQLRAYNMLAELSAGNSGTCNFKPLYGPINVQPEETENGIKQPTNTV